jgi:hypothetical protein
MGALDFPNSPVPGQVFGGWRWDGQKWVMIGSGGGAVGPPVTVSPTPPANPQPGWLWWDTVGGQLYVWFNDGTTGQWVIANSGGGAASVTVGGVAPADPRVGHFWWSTTPPPGLRIWDGGQWALV